ncbi:MAG TPA: TRAP transporter TatT component family protein [Abditibacteriaceae bacterium]|jgi:tetratricopeptide (TPR) repeat protein
MKINLSEWDELWATRHEATTTLGNEIGRAVAQGEESYDVLWRHARLEHFLALQAEVNKDKAAHAQHLFAAELQANKALKLEPQRVEGLFWAGVARIEAARVRGSLAAMSALRPARTNLEAAAKLDETFHFAGPYRVLGRIAHKAPKLAGGDIKHAIELYRKSLQIAPDNSTTLLYLAEALHESGDKSGAEDALKQIIMAPPLDGWRWEQERDKPRARLLLAGADDDAAKT